MLTRKDMRIWQVSAAARAADAPLILAAQPGAGKTIVILTAVADAISTGKIARALIVAPRLILDTVFEQEARRWEHTSGLTFAFAHRFTGADRNRAIFSEPSDIITLTPDLVPTLADAVARGGVVPFDCIVVDEAQMFKAAGSTRTKALHALGSVTPHIILSSGTPTPNGPIDAWSPGRLVAPGSTFWGKSFYAWRSRYFVRKSAFTWRPKPGTDKLVESEIAKVGVSIRLDQASDIPAAYYTSFAFEHDREHRDRILQFMTDGKIELEGAEFGSEREEGNLTLLQELTTGFCYLSPQRALTLSMARVDALQAIAEGVEGPLLVAVKFRHDAEMIRRAFPKAVSYSGSTPTAERTRIISDWNTDRIQMLLGSPSSMGHGLNLQHSSSRTIVWFNTPWSWELYQQFNARLIRTGQTRSVSVIRLESTVGIDKAISQVIARKQSGERALLDALNIVTKGAA